MHPVYKIFDMGPKRSGPSSTAANHAFTNPSSSVPLRRESQLGSSNSGQQRPQFSPRASSLSITPKMNSSTTSVDFPGLVGPGGLREGYLTTPSMPDSLSALETILGRSQDFGAYRHTQLDSSLQKPQRLDTEIHFGKLSLKDFVSRVEWTSARPIDALGQQKSIRKVGCG